MPATSVPDLRAYVSFLLREHWHGGLGDGLQFPVLSGRSSTSWDVDATFDRVQLTPESLKILYESLLTKRLAASDGDGMRGLSQVGATICVLEDDPSAVLGATLAAFSGRHLVVLSPERLNHPVEWAEGRRVTLVASAPRVSFTVLDALSELSVPLKNGQTPTLFSIMTAASLAGLSRLVHRSLTKPRLAEPTSALAVIEHSELAASPLPPMPGCTTLVNAPPETVRRALLGTDSQYASVSFYGHGREYCTRLGRSALCAQGEEGQGEGTCVNAMMCFDPDWLRISPRRVAARLVFVNSCSVVKPAQTIYDYARNLGLDFLDGTVSGVIASYLVADCTPVENFLFHAFAAANYSLSEMVWLLNHASGPSRRLISLGDGELALGDKGSGERDCATSLVPSGSGQWCVLLPDEGKAWNGQLLSLESVELRRSVLNQDVVVFGEDSEAISAGAEGHPVSCVLPGLVPSQSLLYLAAQHEGQLESLRLFERSQPHFRNLSDLLEQGMRRHAQLRAYARFDEYPLAVSEKQLDMLCGLYQSLISVRRRRVVSFGRLEECRQLWSDLERSANARLVDLLGRTHCGEVVRLDRLRERENRSGEPCPYCGSGITTTINDGIGWVPFTLITGICPMCGIIFYRMAEQVVMNVICQDEVLRDSVTSFRVGTRIRNGSGLPLLARATIILFPPVPGVPDFDPSDPVDVVVPPGEARDCWFDVTVPPQMPKNVYVVQLCCAHNFGVDFASRYTRLV